MSEIGKIAGSCEHGVKLKVMDKKTDEKPQPRDDRGWFIQGALPGPGRPKGSISLVEHLKRHLRENEGKNAKEIVEATYRLALDGHPQALKLVWDRIDGPVVQQVDLTAKVQALSEDELNEQLRLLAIERGVIEGTGESEDPD